MSLREFPCAFFERAIDGKPISRQYAFSGICWKRETGLNSRFYEIVFLTMDVFLKKSFPQCRSNTFSSRTISFCLMASINSQ